MKLGVNVDRNYNHNIDERIIDIIKKLGSGSKSKLLKDLQRYFPTISKTTMDRHLNKMVDQNILQCKKEKNKDMYSFTESAEMALKTGLFENVKPKKQNKSTSFNQQKQKPNLQVLNAKHNNEFMNNKITYFLILSQAAAGSRIFIYNKSNIINDDDNNTCIAIPDPKNPRKLVSGDYKLEKGILEEDILKKTNITIKSAFPNFNPIKSIIQNKLRIAKQLWF